MFSFQRYIAANASHQRQSRHLDSISQTVRQVLSTPNSMLRLVSSATLRSQRCYNNRKSAVWLAGLNSSSWTHGNPSTKFGRNHSGDVRSLSGETLLLRNYMAAGAGNECGRLTSHMTNSSLRYIVSLEKSLVKPPYTKGVSACYATNGSNVRLSSSLGNRTGGTQCYNHSHVMLCMSQNAVVWNGQRRSIKGLPGIQMQYNFFSTEPSLKPADDNTKATSIISAASDSSTSMNRPSWTKTTNTPLPNFKLGKTAVPTPPSAPPIDTNPLQSLQGATPKSLIRKGVNLIVSGSKTVFSHLMKLPGNIVFYATHPAETKAAWIKFRDMVKHEAHHYWVGTKLLWADIVTARSLLNKTLEGSALTRRERKQLLRTVSDLFRLIPFSMFVIVPFMEFALPFALRIFPNMLPSTYQDSLKAEENMKRELKSRIAMAQFFQE
jgi:LETM1-like protein